MDKTKLRARAHLMKPTIQVGKGGLDAGMLKEILLQLKKKKLIKVKILRTVEDRDKMIENILMHTEAELVQKIGHVIVLYKK